MPMPRRPSRNSNEIHSQSQSQSPSLRDHFSPSNLNHLMNHYNTIIKNKWKSLGPRAKKLTILLASIYTLLFLIVIYIGPETIFNQTAKIAVQLSELSFGKPLIISIIVILSFPPTVGYGTSIGICGLAFGAGKHSVLEGWSIASISTLLGSSFSFFTLRFLIRRYNHWEFIRGVKDDKRFKAMEMAVRSRGIVMVILIRFCPFPFVYSNLFFASMESVSFFQFLIATTLITPKLFIHVFLGSKMFELMDRDSRKEMDGTSKFINGIYLVLGSLVGMATSFYVYRSTQEILNRYEELDGDVDVELGLENGVGDGNGNGNGMIFDSDSHLNDENLEEHSPFIDRNRDDENQIQIQNQDENQMNSKKNKGLKVSWDR